MSSDLVSNMRPPYVVIASINPLDNLRLFGRLMAPETEVIVVDEGDEGTREKNVKLLTGLKVRFFGPAERQAWFRERFGLDHDEWLSVIPQRCHAETSFGFLVALEEAAESVIELDDDVFPIEGHDLVGGHVHNLEGGASLAVSPMGKWYNTIENLRLEGASSAPFPRGHPYAEDARKPECVWGSSERASALNMGLWAGNPDLDALTTLANGGLDGRCAVRSTELLRQRVTVAPGYYFAICSMNTSFRSRIIPAFYQLYMNSMGIDRFDDIWSGLFIKRIADHLGDSVSLGMPLVRHVKRPRDTFKDLRAELEGMIMNELLWRVVDSLELDGGDYLECYAQLTAGIRMRLADFADKRHRDFLQMTVEKMELWTKVVEKLT